MIALHTIRPSVITAPIWLRPHGANGRTLGRGGFSHIYHVERGTPPALGEQWRRHWYPYAITHTREFVLNPICGPIVSTSIWPQASGWGVNNRCTNCELLEGTTALTYGDTRNNDPWTQLPWATRNTTPDPITGQ